MSERKEQWLEDGAKNGWEPMRPATRWKRLPVIRHMRAFYLKVQIERHYVVWNAMGAMRSGYDDWALVGIWRGYS